VHSVTFAIPPPDGRHPCGRRSTAGYPLLQRYNSSKLIRTAHRPKVCIKLSAALFLNRQDLICWVGLELSKIRNFVND
jgi:hypothetical protein